MKLISVQLWECFWPKLLKLQLTSDSTETVTSTSRGETVPYMDWNSEYTAAQKCTFSHLFLLLAIFYAENRKGEEKKELDFLISHFPSSPPPYARISCISPLRKLFHTIHSSHNHLWGSSVFSASAVLAMWLLQSLTNPFIMGEHCTYCALSIQSNRNMVL